MKFTTLKQASLAVLFLLSFTASVFASELNSYKSQGLIGEMPNGLLGVVVSAPSADVTRTVNQINSERLQRYREVATRNNLDLNQVQALAGEKLIRQSPRGHYVQDASGNWRQR